MEAPLQQPPQPGVTSAPLRPKPTPPPRNPLHRRGSLDGRPRPDGMGGPDSNSSSPSTSPQRVPGGGESIASPTWGKGTGGPATSPQHRPEARGSDASPATSPLRAPDTSGSFPIHQQPSETKGSASPVTSPMQAGRSGPAHEQGSTERWMRPETKGGNGSNPTSPTMLDSRVPNASPLWAPPTSPQRRPEVMTTDSSTQWVPANRIQWRPEMSTSFSSSARPMPLDTRGNDAASPQQMLDRSRQGPNSPRWAQPKTRGTETGSPQPPPKTRRSPATSPQRATQVRGREESPQRASGRINGTGAQAASEATLVNAVHTHRASETVAETASPQRVLDSRVMSDTTSPEQAPGMQTDAGIAIPRHAPEVQPAPGIVSPKRVYSYSVILTGTSNVQPNAMALGPSSPSYGRSETPTSPTWTAAPMASPQTVSPGFSPTAGAAAPPQIAPETRPSADPSSPQHGSDSRLPVNPASPQRHLASKPPLPGPSGPRVSSSHPGFPSAAPALMQYSAPKSSLYSSLSPVPEQAQSNGDPVSYSTSSSEPGAQPGLVPESAPASSPRRDAGSLSSLDPSLSGYRCQPPAPDSMSYLDSVSMMSGTMESLSLMDDASSMGSDSEINGSTYRRTDKYGFLGGNQFSGGTESSLPVDVARQRELKWLDMFKHWDKWVSRRFQKVKLRCRKGIPSSLRAKAWQCLSNSTELIERNTGKFEELERNPGDAKWLDVIEKDLHRQFPFHEMFAARGGHGQQDLYRILKAYTIYRPDEGYCQAQAPVAAVLLMHMPAEQAFWCLVQICDKYLPGYYSAGLEAIQLDGEIFFALLRRASPMAYRHLKKYKIDPILYMTEWFMCIFSRTLPWSSVLRVWDMFFCEGVKIIFRVGLVLLRHTLGSVDKLRSCQGMYETMEKLRNLPTEYMHESFLVHEVSSLPVTEALIERENTTQQKKWRENRGELQYKPSRRLHGTRAIFEEHHRMNPPLTASSSLLSLTSLRRASKEDRWRDKGQKENPGFSPAHSIGNLAISSGSRAALPSAAVNLSSNSVAKHSKAEKTKGKGENAAGEGKKLALGPMSPGQVVSEGLHPALPSPTGNVMPLGDPKKAKDRKKELEKQRAKEQKEKERQEKEREKELEKQRAKEQKEQKEKERLDKEREKKLQRERAKEEARFKKDRKMSVRKKEPAEVLPAAPEKGPGDASTHPEKPVAAPDGASEPGPQPPTTETAAPAGSPGTAVQHDSYF